MSKQASAILLVEDNAMEMELTLRALKAHAASHPVTVARTGEEALDYVYRRGRFAGDAPVPGLIMLDINLPKADGIEVLREIRAHPIYRTVPVVMLTTSQQETDVRRSYELGANSYIAKPVSFETFLELIGRITIYWLATNVPAPAPIRPMSDRSGAGAPADQTGDLMPKEGV